MKFKNIEALTVCFYPDEREKERYALRELVYTISGCGQDVTGPLYRGNIRSIKDLHNASIDELRRLRDVGPKKLTAILKVKEFINESIEEP